MRIYQSIEFSLAFFMHKFALRMLNHVRDVGTLHQLQNHLISQFASRGVPQGFHLGPIFFLVYAADL